MDTPTDIPKPRKLSKGSGFKSRCVQMWPHEIHIHRILEPHDPPNVSTIATVAVEQRRRRALIVLIKDSSSWGSISMWNVTLTSKFGTWASILCHRQYPGMLAYFMADVGTTPNILCHRWFPGMLAYFHDRCRVRLAMGPIARRGRATIIKYKPCYSSEARLNFCVREEAWICLWPFTSNSRCCAWTDGTSIHLRRVLQMGREIGKGFL